MRFPEHARFGLAAALVVMGIAACAISSSQAGAAKVATAPSPRVPSPPASISPAAPIALAAPRAATTRPARVEPAPPPAPLPEGIVPGKETRVAVRGDRAAIVVHAPPGVSGAIVYLHGVCGDAFAPRAWYQVAIRYGTLITLLGDDACEGRSGRFRWRRNAELLRVRIDRALDAVKQARGGQLDADQLTIIGYSQGASRVEAIASRIAPRCTRLVLGSPPFAPDPEAYAPHQSVAVVAGALEDNDARREGVQQLIAAGMRATFMTLPGAHHGQYGADGERVMGEALAWLHTAR